jgi:hypothetical protein
VPPIGGTVVVTFQNASWLVLGQYVEVKTAGGTSVSGTLQVTNISGNQVTLLNPSIPSLALANTTAAGLLAQVSGNATDYIGGDNAPHALPPSGVSADAGNIATLGSDSRIYVPDPTPVITSVRLRSFNAIGNPNFEVDQRNVGNAISLAAGNVIKFGCDRWNLNKNAATGAVNAGQGVLTSVVPGTNFQISSRVLQLNVATAQATLAAGEYVFLQQAVEAPQLRELLGDVHSIQLLVNSSVAGNFTLCLRNAATTYTYVSAFSLAAGTWTLITIPNIPVWVSGGGWATTPGSVGYYLSICLGSGSTFIAPSGAAAGWQNGNFFAAPGQTNWLATANAYFTVAFVQHEPGAVCATPIDKPFTQNYEECLRYYCKSYDYETAIGTASAAASTSAWQGSTTGFYTATKFPKNMAKLPTGIIYSWATGAANATRFSGVDYAVTSVSLGKSYLASFGTATLPAVAAGATTSFHYTADTGW